VDVSQPLSVATKILSCAGVPMIADVIVHHDRLECEYREMCLDKKLPLWMRQAAYRVRRVLNKYYEKTDKSELYRLAMLLHPSMRTSYFDAAGWEGDWIDTAIEIAETCWKTHYKATSNERIVAPEKSQFSYSKVSSRIALLPLYHLSHYSAEPLIKHGEEGEPVMLDPLAWWYGQWGAGNQYLGLMQMALDVLSTPGPYFNDQVGQTTDPCAMQH
ncbi:hypothetical protein BDV93DRAFT_454383, partial [Ceratobasidium sp. AG-I]